MEHRWGHRREINRIVQLKTRNGLIARGRITNVSMSGAFVVSPLPARLLSYVQVGFTSLRHGIRNRMAVEAQIVRKERGGFGIEWSELNPEVIQCLASLPIEPARAVYHR